MNPDLAYWYRLLGLLAVEILAVIGVAGCLAAAARRPGTRRLVWQVALGAIACVGAWEISGAGSWMALLSIASEETRVAAVRSGMEGSEVQIPANAIPPSHSSTDAASSTSSGEASAAWWPLFLWCGGTALLLVRSAAARCWVARRVAHLGGPGPELTASAGRLARLVGLRDLKVVEWPGLVAPLAWGVRRPSLALPAGFASFSHLERDAMLMHELAHLAARDPFWMGLAEVICAAFWWHPGVWWVRRRLQFASEANADRASALIPGGPTALAESLVKLARRMSSPTASWMLSATGRGMNSDLGRRVTALLNLNTSEGRLDWRAGWVLWFAALASAGFVTVSFRSWSVQPSLREMAVSTLLEHRTSGSPVKTSSTRAAVSSDPKTRATDTSGSGDASGEPSGASPTGPETAGTNMALPGILIEVQVIELPEGNGDEAGLAWVFGQDPETDAPPRIERPSGDLPLANSPDVGNVRVELSETRRQTAILSSAQAGALLRRMERIPGFKVLCSPRVLTRSGTAAQVEISELRTLVTGVDAQEATETNQAGFNYRTEVVPVGPRVEVLPVLTNGQWNLSVSMMVTAFLGYDDPAANAAPALLVSKDDPPLTAQLPLPRLRVRQAMGSADVASGQHLFIRGPVEETVTRTKGNWFRAAKTVVERKRVYALLHVTKAEN